MTSLADVLWIAALGGLFYYMMSKGGGCCGGHDHKDQGKEEHKGNTPANDPAAHQHSLADKGATESPAAQDPVCGMKVNKISSAPTSNHFGRTFHFCSEQCRKLFEINPGKYTSSI